MKKKYLKIPNTTTSTFYKFLNNCKIPFRYFQILPNIFHAQYLPFTVSTSRNKRYEFLKHTFSITFPIFFAFSDTSPPFLPSFLVYGSERSKAGNFESRPRARTLVVKRFNRADGRSLLTIRLPARRREIRAGLGNDGLA